MIHHPLYLRMTECGHKNVTTPFEADILVMVDYCLTRKLSTRLSSEFKNIPFRVLIREETDMVSPVQYEENIENQFHLIIDLGRLPLLASNRFSYPYKLTQNHFKAKFISISLDLMVKELFSTGIMDFKNWLNREKFFVHLGTNRLSITREDTYRQRRDTLNRLSEHSIKVYGRYWKRLDVEKIEDRIRTIFYSIRINKIVPLKNLLHDLLFINRFEYCGSIEDKFSLLNECQFVFISENSPHHLTEKLFDVILSGAVPVYQSINLEAFGLVSELAMSLAEFEQLNNAADKSTMMRRAQEILEFGQNFIKSETFAAQHDYNQIFAKVFDFILSKYRLSEMPPLGDSNKGT